jgi:hypothetical protein
LRQDYTWPMADSLFLHGRENGAPLTNEATADHPLSPFTPFPTAVASFVGQLYKLFFRGPLVISVQRDGPGGPG